MQIAEENRFISLTIALYLGNIFEERSNLYELTMNLVMSAILYISKHTRLVIRGYNI